MIRALSAGALLIAAPAAAQTSQQRAEKALAEAVPGTRFGGVVADEDGKEIAAINPDQRFIPASNTKVFTTAAAYMTLAGLDQPDTVGGAAVRLAGNDVMLEGRGDARLSSRAASSGVCWRMISESQMGYGSAVSRHGRSRRCIKYHLINMLAKGVMAGKGGQNYNFMLLNFNRLD